MYKSFISLIISVLLLNPAASIAAATLASATLPLTATEVIDVEKYLDDKGVGIRATSAAGEKLLELGEIGVEDKLFIIDEKASGLAIKDLDGDGTPEIITAAFYGPKASGLYVFKFDAEKRRFAAIKFVNSADPTLSTDFMTSDMRQDGGEDMVIAADGSIVALGMIYPADASSEPVAGLYTWKLAEGSFKLTEKKPVPTDK